MLNATKVKKTTRKVRLKIERKIYAMLKKILNGEEIELTLGQAVLVWAGGIACSVVLGVVVYLWLSGELWQWGTTWGVVGRI